MKKIFLMVVLALSMDVRAQGAPAFTVIVDVPQSPTTSLEMVLLQNAAGFCGKLLPQRVSEIRVRWRPGQFYAQAEAQYICLPGL